MSGSDRMMDASMSDLSGPMRARGVVGTGMSAKEQTGAAARVEPGNDRRDPIQNWSIRLQEARKRVLESPLLNNAS